VQVCCSKAPCLGCPGLVQDHAPKPLNGLHLDASHRELPTYIQRNAHPVHHDYSLSFSRAIVRSHWRAIVVTRPPRTQSAPSRLLRCPQAKTNSLHGSRTPEVSSLGDRSCSVWRSLCSPIRRLSGIRWCRHNTGALQTEGSSMSAAVGAEAVSLLAGRRMAPAVRPCGEARTCASFVPRAPAERQLPCCTINWQGAGLRNALQQRALQRKNFARFHRRRRFCR
jgi:hypothetical protein